MADTIDLNAFEEASIGAAWDSVRGKWKADRKSPDQQAKNQPADKQPTPEQFEAACVDVGNQIADAFAQIISEARKQNYPAAQSPPNKQE